MELAIQTSSQELEYNKILSNPSAIAGANSGQFVITLTQQNFHQKTSGFTWKMINGTDNSRQIDLSFPGLFTKCEILLDGKTVLDVQNFSQYLKQQMMQDPFYNQFLVTSTSGKFLQQNFMKDIKNKDAADAHVNGAQTAFGVNEYFIPFSLLGLQSNSEFFTVPQLMTINLTKVKSNDLIFFCGDATTIRSPPTNATANGSNITEFQFISKYTKELQVLKFYDFIEQKDIQQVNTGASKDYQESYAVSNKNICYKRAIQLLNSADNVTKNLQIIDLYQNNQKIYQAISPEYFVESCKNSNLQNPVQNDSMILFQNTKYTNQLLQYQFRLETPGNTLVSRLLITYYNIQMP